MLRNYVACSRMILKHKAIKVINAKFMFMSNYFVRFNFVHKVSYKGIK